ncbi:STAS domain-containing protein [Methylobacterium sp. J-068]|nr:STAS domain-containing protein [Methylobacterium sp. J-068]
MSEAFAGTADLTLDCADVARADIALVQLVVSAVRTAAREAKHVRLANMSPTVEAAFQRAGVPPRGPDCPVS